MIHSNNPYMPVKLFQSHLCKFFVATLQHIMWVSCKVPVKVKLPGLVSSRNFYFYFFFGLGV